MYSRVVIFGRPGSGKSTFALKLHKKTGIPVYHLDKIYFTHNWVKADYEEFLQKQNQIIQQKSWIIDGCSLKSLHMRYSRADIVFFFNYPRLLCVWRLFKRVFDKDPAVDDRPDQCHEWPSWTLIKYLWTFEYRQNYRLKHLLSQLKSEYPQVKFVEITNDQTLKKVFEEYF